MALASLLFVLAPSRAATQQHSFIGDWLSDGYGTYARIDAESLTLFEITPVSSIESGRATRRSDAAAAGSTVFQREGVDLVASPTDEPDQFTLQYPGAASTIVFRRVECAPEVVGRPLSTDPETTFEVFWQTFNIHYPFFALREVDWDAMRAQYRPRVSSTTTPAELFAVLRAMIEPLHDAHTSLQAQATNQGFGGEKPDPQPLDERGRQTALALVLERYALEQLEAGCNGYVKHGKLDSRTGYLRIEAFSGYSRRPGFQAYVDALDETLDAAMASFERCEALVIDVRLNNGGSDVLGLAVASRLTDREYVAFVKRARNDPVRADAFTAPQTTTVTPSARPRFLGQVFLLTSRYSVSAAETFTMALLGRTPHVIRVGESTQGVFSDVFGRELPNGWSFGLPNEVFLTEQGEHFERRGVPPEHEVPVFAPDDLESGRDACLDKVFELIDDE